MVDLLLRFRTHKIAVIADIERAFLQIELSKKDRDATRFLWVREDWKPGMIPHLRELRMSRVLFGATSSPYLLAGTKRFHLKQCEDRFHDTCQELNRSLYVDDLASGNTSVGTTYKLCEESRTILGSAGMLLKKWCSNSEDLLDKLRQEWLPMTPNDEVLIQNRDGLKKVLGLNWDPVSDCLSLQMNSLAELLATHNKTKRRLLQFSARIFDPLGFVTPVVVQVRCMFQEAWQLKIPWDDPLPEVLQKQFDDWLSELPYLANVKIDRYLNGIDSTEIDDHATYQLHVFCDSSEVAYGAVGYLKVECSGTVSTFLLISKGRVAPLKRPTIPRLELLAALVGARLANYVLKSLKDVKLEVHCWTDSTVVLYWIQSTTKTWKQFVSHRVAEIQKLTEPTCWKHCPGKSNPADLISRGCTARKLLLESFWWNGPSWLALSAEFWPVHPVVKNDVESIQDITQASVTVETSNFHTILLQRFSSLLKLLRVTSWILRFGQKLRRKSIDANDCLTAEELQRAMDFWVNWVQKDCFKEEMQQLADGNTFLTTKSKLRDLKPFLDKSGVLRLGGRLGSAELSEDELHPVILPGKHIFTDLVVMRRHLQLFHAGVVETLSDLRSKFWILKGRQAVKRVLRSCQICSRNRLKAGKMVEAPLPKARVNPAPAFKVTGVDYAGPLFVKDKQQGQTKAYILLFTCAVTRAIHLELLMDQSTAGFLMALRRFVARRGKCQVIYSDNAKTFRGANRELQNLWSKFSCKEVQDFYSSQGIQWRFIAERAPWWGGFWERMVRSVKTHLKRVLGQAKLNFEELLTVIVEIEAIINSRPLTRVSEDPQDEQPLTPSHFLLGDRLTSLPDRSTVLGKSSGPLLRRRWQYCQKTLNQFWQRWTQEYLLQLRSAHQCQNVDADFIPKVGDLVLVKETKVPRHLWPCAIVEQLNVGRDQKVRSCLLRMKNRGRIRRPIQLLFPLEM